MTSPQYARARVRRILAAIAAGLAALVGLRHP